MRILKSIGLVVAWGLYFLFGIKFPLLAIGLALLTVTIGIFCWGYFILFKPK